MPLAPYDTEMLDARSLSAVAKLVVVLSSAGKSQCNTAEKCHQTVLAEPNLIKFYSISQIKTSW